MSLLETPLCELLGVRLPIVQAPMANNAPPALAAAVSTAGAWGSVAGATLSPAELQAAIREARDVTDLPSPSAGDVPQVRSSVTTMGVA